jgi:glutamine cyclotransferase
MGAMKISNADIIRELGPLPDGESVAGVTYDGRRLWVAAGDKLRALDPENGQALQALDIPASAGTAFDGKHLFQIAGDLIRKIDIATHQVLATIPTPASGGCSGLAWAEGSLWVGCYPERKIHQVDPETGKVLRTIESNRFVTGVTWVGGELWHGTWEDERSEIRHVDAQSGEVLEALQMPDGVIVAGLESDGGDRFFCGGGSSGKVRVVRRPRRTAVSAAGASAGADAPTE